MLRPAMTACAIAVVLILSAVSISAKPTEVYNIQDLPAKYLQNGTTVLHIEGKQQLLCDLQQRYRIGAHWFPPFNLSSLYEGVRNFLNRRFPDSSLPRQEDYCSCPDNILK